MSDPVSPLFVRITGWVWLVVVSAGVFMLIQEAAGLNRSVVDPSDYGIGAASTSVTLFAFAGCLLAGTGCVIAMMRGRLEVVFGLLGLFALATLITWSRDDIPIGIWLRGLAWALPIGAGLLALARKQDVPVERRLRTAGAIACTLAVLMVGGGLAVRDTARRVDAQQRAREQLASDPVLAPFLSSPSNPTVSTSPSTPPEARFSISTPKGWQRERPPGELTLQSSNLDDPLQDPDTVVTELLRKPGAPMSGIAAFWYLEPMNTDPVFEESLAMRIAESLENGAKDGRVSAIGYQGLAKGAPMRDARELNFTYNWDGTLFHVREIVFDVPDSAAHAIRLAAPRDDFHAQLPAFQAVVKSWRRR